MRLRVKQTVKDENIQIKEKDQYTQEEIDIMYKRVREYLYDHQGENAIKVSLETGVPKDIIMDFLRQGKISLAENTRSWLRNCKVCGSLIETGDTCIDCMRKKMDKILNPQNYEKSKKNMSGYTKQALGGQELGYGRRIRKK